jgi:hypothetical protein
MYTRDSLLDFIYFDIETKPRWNSFEDMPVGLQKIWLDKHHFKAVEKENVERQKKINLANLHGNSGMEISHSHIPTITELYIKESGLLPEFAEVYCISFGVFTPTFDIVIDTFCENNEKDTIESFLTILNRFKDKFLFGYNTNEFDIPFLLKRMWINKILNKYPPQLQLKDAKPWTIKNQDHMVNWKAGSWTNVSLDLLCEVFGIPTPKDEFSNSEFTTLLTSGAITKAQAIKYCEKDVKALMELVLSVSSTTSNYEPAPKSWKER